MKTEELLPCTNVPKMKTNVGILIFGDPTRGGTISSEVKFLKNLYDTNAGDTDFYIVTVNKSVTKKVYRERNSTYNFPHEIITVFSEEDFYKLKDLSCIVTYPGHSNFFGGYLNDNVIKMYKIISEATNVLEIPVFVRINDSEIKVRDYRLLSENRLESDKDKPASAFMKDPVNVGKARNLVACTPWNYERVYWFANGSKEACDWVAETMYDREDELFRVAEREVFVRNAIYVSDDIFFLVKQNYERFRARYSVAGSLVNAPVELGIGRAGKDPERTERPVKQFCYIGFFDTVNMARARAFNSLLKANVYDVPLKIFGKGTEILTKLHGKSNVDIEEGFIMGDSDEYFDFLNKHLAYIFVGKGQPEARYIGKTVYDAIVARTPVVVYKKCDSGMITFRNPEFYFENERELHEMFLKLQDPETRQRWIDEQTAEIFSKLPPTEFSFSNYCDLRPELNTDLFYHEAVVLKNTRTAKPALGASMKKSTALF